jgi:sugar lactone lactonase YvrE
MRSGPPRRRNEAGRDASQASYPEINLYCRISVGATAFQDAGGTNIMGMRGWKALISLLLVAGQTLLVIPAVSQGGSITTFSDGSPSADALLTAAGMVTFANITVPVRSILMNGSVGVSPIAVQGFYPQSPSLDFGADGSQDWGFSGTGYGAFGGQTMFSDGALMQDFNFSSPGTVRCNITLPQNAVVKDAGFEIFGSAGQKWWNSSWNNRIPLKVTELAGRDQTDFVVEVLLDTRNWTLGSAEREFRMILQDGTTLEGTEVPLQVMDEINNGSKCFEASLLFAVQNLSANASLDYHLYFNNPGATLRSQLYRDFNPRLIQNRLMDQSAGMSIMGPFRRPAGASVDSFGNYWVADTSRNCVFGYARTLGVPDVLGSDGTHFSKPVDVVVTPSGRVAVCDGGNYRVQVFEPNGSFAFTIGQTGVPGTDNAHFSHPVGLGTDGAGWLYVTDSGSTFQRVQVFDANGTYLATIGGAGGQGDYQFAAVAGIHVSPSKEMLVADTGNHRLQVFGYTSPTNWTYNYTIGVTGQAGTDSDHLDSPADATMDGSGRTFVADYGNSRVQIFSGTGFVSSIGVLKTPRPDNSHLNMPTGVAVSPDGTLFVSDYVPSTALNSRIAVYDSLLRRVRSLGDGHWTGLMAAGSSENDLNLPSGVAAGALGTIFVSDSYNHRVQLFGPLGDHLMTFGVTGVAGNDTSHFHYPRGLDVDPGGKLLVADGGNLSFLCTTANHRVMVFNDLGDGVADKILGMTGQFGNDAVHLNGPWDVSVNASGRIGVADTGYAILAIPNPLIFGQRVQIFNDLADSSADDTYGVAGVPGNSSTHLNWPAGVGLSDSGWTAVADAGNSRVVVFKNDGDHTADIVVNPSTIPGSGNGELRQPLDVDVDSRGNIFIADSGNHRIQIYDPAGTYVGTLGVTGVSLSDASHFNGPGGIHLGGDDRIYIADTNNNRVMRMTSAALAMGEQEAVAIPWDVSVDVGADDIIDWNLPGKLDGSRRIASLAAPLNAILANMTGTPDGYGNPMVTFPVDIRNGGRGLLALTDVLLDYDCTIELAYVSEALEPYFRNQSYANASGNMTIPVSYSAASAGGIRLAGLNITADFAPVLLSPIPDIAMDEDTSNATLCDLARHFRDDFDTRLSFRLVNVSNSSIADIMLAGDSMLAVDCTMPSSRDWNGMIEMAACATDSRGLSTLSNEFRIIVRPVNDPPRIAGSPESNAWVGEEWSYSVNATDPENRTLSHSLDQKPAGMVVDTLSGRLSWTPTQEQEGDHNVTVRVSDGQLSAIQSFVINVSGPSANNHPPEIFSDPVLAAQIGSEYIYAVMARDQDNDTLSYSLLRSPANMTVGNFTGVIRWTPVQAQKGVHEVIVRVSDSKSYRTQAFNITVVKDLSELIPNITITEPSPNARVSGNVRMMGTAAGAAGASIASVEVSSDAGATWRPASGKTAWLYQLDTTKLSNGPHRILVRVRDTAFREASANITLNVQNAPSAGPPPTFLGLDLLIWVLLAIIICAITVGAAYAAARRRRRAPPVPAAPLVSSHLAPSTTADARSSVATTAPPSISSQAAVSPGSPQQSSPAAPQPSYPATPQPPYPAASQPPYSVASTSAPSISSHAAVSPVPPKQSYPIAMSTVTPAITSAEAASAAARHPWHVAKSAPPPPRPVDSVFLIYHDGRLITYFSRSDSMKIDDTLDMIRRFVKASFSGELGRLDAMTYENMNIIMERGNLMYMVVITPLVSYEALRRDMRALLDDIDRRYRVVFKIWDGDFGKVKGVKSMIERFAGEKTEEIPEPPAVAQSVSDPSHSATPSQHSPYTSHPATPSQHSSYTSHPAAPPQHSPYTSHPATPSQPSSFPSHTAAPPQPSSYTSHPATPSQPSSFPSHTATPPQPYQSQAPPHPSQPVQWQEVQSAPSTAHTSSLPQNIPQPEPLIPTPPPLPPPQPRSQPYDENLARLEDRFLRGEMTELTYREMKEKLSKNK